MGALHVDSNLSMRLTLGITSSSCRSSWLSLATMLPRCSSVKMSLLSSILISKSVMLKCREVSLLDCLLSWDWFRTSMKEGSLSLDSALMLWLRAW